MAGDDASHFSEYLALLRTPDFVQALQAEAHRRATAMLEGLAEYQDVQIEVEATAYDVLWEKGQARLLDYGGPHDAMAVLCIPSLINKHYILDLYPERSLIQFLQSQGYRPLVLDWGEPGWREQGYDSADYIYYIAHSALRALKRCHRGPIAVLGYCMGGVFALALAQLEPVDRLVLLAAPWDYHAEGMPPPVFDAAIRDSYEQLLLTQETVPPVWTQTLFHMLNPWHFQEKFSRFCDMPESEQYHFVAVESWVNDGVPLAPRVAGECFIEWPYDNKLAAGQWRVAGQVINPQRVRCPAFVATPAQDRIVPQPCSHALAVQLPDATTIAPPSGHVSMVVGGHARRRLWQPLVRWLES